MLLPFADFVWTVCWRRYLSSRRHCCWRVIFGSLS